MGRAGEADGETAGEPADVGEADGEVEEPAEGEGECRAARLEEPQAATSTTATT
jgi:hypothetical protein